jgi:hypothetical protein
MAVDLRDHDHTPEPKDESMELEIVIQGLALVGVVGASILDVYRTEQQARPRPAARARTSGQQRCPFCHLGLPAGDLSLVSCKTCATLHHAECWGEHQGCSVYGCSRKRRRLAADLPEITEDDDEDADERADERADEQTAEQEAAEGTGGGASTRRLEHSSG